LNIRKKFPESTLYFAVKNYPVVNKNKLRTDLTVLYERDDFRNIAQAVQLLQLIYKNNLEGAFHEATTLLKITVTIPMMIAEPERFFRR
jgi:hypothetical protein